VAPAAWAACTKRTATIDVKEGRPGDWAPFLFTGHVIVDVAARAKFIPRRSWSLLQVVHAYFDHLFVAQGDHGIDARGSTRWNVRREQGDDD
jgi:hypothetical protein